MLTIGLLLLIAFALSAIFTIAELAVFTLGDSRVRTLVEEGFRGGASLARLRQRPRRVQVLLRLGDALSDATAALLAGLAGLLLWGTPGLVTGAAVAVGLIVVLGELLPMSIVARHGVRIALGIAPALDLACRVLAPVLGVLERLAGPAGVRNGNGIASEAATEIRQLTDLGHTEGVIEEHERQLIERAFQLDETKAWDIMTPRVDMFAWPDSLTLAEIAPQLRSVPYSRVPVYGESVDDITGVLYIRDAYQALISGQRDVRLIELAREPLVVPGSVPLTKLLRDFQTRRIHLAIVVDEYGGTDGLVTLEDVLEELVGEIVDEMDVAEEVITRVSRNEIVAAGDADLREINHAFNTSFPQLEHRSLNGYLLEELGRVPAPGEVLERDGIRIEVLEATETQVLRARLRRLAPAPEAAAAGGEPAPAHEPPASASSPVAKRGTQPAPAGESLRGARPAATRAASYPS
jgi:putative hemolysin